MQNRISSSYVYPYLLAHDKTKQSDTHRTRDMYFFHLLPILEYIAIEVTKILKEMG